MAGNQQIVYDLMNSPVVKIVRPLRAKPDNRFDTSPTAVKYRSIFETYATALSKFIAANISTPTENSTTTTDGFCFTAQRHRQCINPPFPEFPHWPRSNDVAHASYFPPPSPKQPYTTYTVSNVTDLDFFRFSADLIFQSTDHFRSHGWEWLVNPVILCPETGAKILNPRGGYGTATDYHYEHSSFTLFECIKFNNVGITRSVGCFPMFKQNSPDKLINPFLFSASCDLINFLTTHTEGQYDTSQGQRL
jgi:hypothetical protein